MAKSYFLFEIDFLSFVLDIWFFFFAIIIVFIIFCVIDKQLATKPFTEDNWNCMKARNQTCLFNFSTSLSCYFIWHKIAIIDHFF